MSKSIVGVVVSFLALVAGLVGIDVPADVREVIVEHAYNVVFGVLGLVSLGKLLYDKYKARKAPQVSG